MLHNICNWLLWYGIMHSNIVHIWYNYLWMCATERSDLIGGIFWWVSWMNMRTNKLAESGVVIAPLSRLTDSYNKWLNTRLEMSYHFKVGLYIFYSGYYAKDFLKIWNTIQKCKHKFDSLFGPILAYGCMLLIQICTTLASILIILS